MFRTVCPHCFHEYMLDEKYLGKQGTCAGCRQGFELKEATVTQIGTRAYKANEEVKSDSSFDLQLPQETTRPNGPGKPHVTDGRGEWQVGDVVLGIYEVRMIAPHIPYAEGGVGVVHRVHHREWDLDLAVKSPKPEVFSTENGKLSYEREAQTWIELGLHPNIVTCYLVRRIDDIPRLFAEFVADGSLRDWMRDGRLYNGGPEESLARLLDIAIQFAWGLQHAHRQKLLHLDVKPANVMMSGLTAKVTDFGLAQGVSAGVQDGGGGPGGLNPQSGGMTPGYCSPEQYAAFTALQQGRTVDIPPITLRSDIWSWAVSILALFHGRPPCRRGGQTARKVFELFMNNPPQNGHPAIPPALAELMFQCFEINPRKRPESMEQIADRLSKIYRDIVGSAFPRRRPVNASWTPESINNRAASMLDLNKPREAALLLSQAARMLPWHPEITYNQTLMAWRWSHLTDIDALERLETLAKTRDSSATAYYALGLLQRERGNPQSAMDAFEAALEREEDRNDVQRAILATEGVSGKSCRCVERLVVPPGLERELLLDENEDFLLFPNERSLLGLRETTTAQERMVFKRSSSGGSDRIALSDNLQYELVTLDAARIAMCHVGSPNPLSVFRALPWSRIGALGTDTAPKDSPYRFLVHENMIDVIEKTTGNKLGELFGHEGRITAFDLDPKARYAVTGGIDRTLRIWELPSCRCLRTFRSLGGSVDSVYLARNGKFALAMIAGGALRIWDIEILLTGEPFHAPILLSLVSSSEEVGRQQAEMGDCCDEIRQAVREGDFATALATVDRARKLPNWETARATLDVWDAITRSCRRRAPADVLCVQTFVGHHDTITGIALSLDGVLAATSSQDNTIRIWDLAEGRGIRVLEGHSDWVRSLAMTADTKYVISGSWDTSVRVWDVATGRCMRRFGEPVKSITRLALHPQGRSVAIANGAGAVIFWDMMTNRVTGRFQAHDGSVNDLRFSRDGHYLVTGGDDHRVRIWETATQREIRVVHDHDKPVAATLLTTDLSHLLSTDRGGRLLVRDLKRDRIVQDTAVHLGDATSIDNIADDRFVLTSGKDRIVRITPLFDGPSRLIEGHPAPVSCLAVDLPGRRFVTGCEDAVVRVWDLSWDYLFRGPQEVDERCAAYLRTLLALFSGNGNTIPTPDANALRRLRTEMEYRGFGDVPPETMAAAVDEILADWPRKGRVVLE